MLACTVAIVLFESPADAGPCVPGFPNADGRIKFGAIPYSGDDVFNSDGTGQTQGVLTGDTELEQRTWKFRFQNEESKSKTIRVGADLSGNTEDFKARFLRRGNNVTEKVLSGELKFRNVPAGELTSVLKLRMGPRPSANLGDQLKVEVGGRYASQEACAADVVIAKIEIFNV